MTPIKVDYIHTLSSLDLEAFFNDMDSKLLQNLIVAFNSSFHDFILLPIHIPNSGRAFTIAFHVIPRFFDGYKFDSEHYISEELYQKMQYFIHVYSEGYNAKKD